MSIKIMASIWEGGPSGSTHRFVLIALADNANDDGECWPSIATLSRKTGLCERSVRTSLRWLEAEGWLATQIGAARAGANRYRISAPPPAADAPGIKCPPAADAPHPGIKCPTPPAADAPEPSYNHQEPSLLGDDTPKPSRRRPEVDLPDGWVPNEINVSDAQAKGFSAERIDDEANRFRDYHTAKGNRFRNWDAAWRTWIGNAAKFAGGGGMAGKAAPGGYGRGSSIASIVARRRAEGEV